MNDLAPTITDLKTKIEILVKLHQELKKNNEDLNTENENLKKTIEEQNVTIENLKKMNLEIEQTKNKEQNSIVTDTKSKINELVLEIDNCIALLK